MRILGLLGGMSWHSTVDYYRVINEQAAAARGGHASAPIALQSVDFARVRELQVAEDWDGAGRLLAEAGRRCEGAGAEALLICTNLMHRVADAVEAAVDVPLLRITDALAERAHGAGHATVGLLGTRWTMEEDFYVGRLRAAGLEVVVPDAAARGEVDRIIFDELTRGIVTPRSADTYRSLLRDLAEDGAEAIILGCTEIQLLVGADDSGVPLLDSMRVHAEAAAAWALDDALVSV